MPSLGRLHLITDTRPGRDPLGVLRAALAAARSADATADLVVQVRVEDDMSDRDAYEFTVRAVAECTAYQVTCLVNDRLHIALATGAAGAHVGAADLPVDAARRVLGPAAILGATARDPATGQAAVAAGATYLGVGPCHATGTKTGLPDPIGPAGLAAVAAAVDVPVIAIAGVTVDRVAHLLAAGAHGVAVVGAIAAAADPGRATAELLTAVRQRPTAAADGAPA
ncbi:thiamine phosphate synthase [Solwaraspora sp. WMMD791]|uniref:thiamine phosphate synthase n=1 Tax=Solwaraspora sp. WMMD791 TaxID=3016086 RepID=UPI00249AB942|nr:thiamine phosphate synthase [Solwaraspora sp. WMMD791]WFE25099.1 thiamine phosphate synthase [Solwaraspora sp. WMMD791]